MDADPTGTPSLAKTRLRKSESPKEVVSRKRRYLDGILKATQEQLIEDDQVCSLMKNGRFSDYVKACAALPYSNSIQTSSML